MTRKKENLNCAACHKPLGLRPPHLILSHRAEGINVYAICSSLDCWIEVGRKMSEGKR